MKRATFIFVLTASSQVDEVALFRHESRFRYYADFWRFWRTGPWEGGGYAVVRRFSKARGAEDMQPKGGPSAPWGLSGAQKRKTPGMRGASRAFESQTGAPSGIRTLDLGIKSPLLWPAELTAQMG